MKKSRRASPFKTASGQRGSMLHCPDFYDGRPYFLSRTVYTELLEMYSGTISFMTFTVAMAS